MKKQVLRKPAEAYIKDWAKGALFPHRNYASLELFK